MPKRATRTPAGRRAESLKEAQKSGRLASRAITEGAKIICPSCGKYSDNIIRDFYNSPSYVYEYSRSMPICRDCAKALLTKFATDFQDPLMGMNRFCQVMDIYYNEALAESSMGKTWLSSYIRGISNPTYAGKTYTDTIAEGHGLFSLDPSAVVKDGEEVIPKKLIRRWGIGFTLAQYNWMQDE